MKKTIKDINLANKKVLLRLDFNVPIDNGVITDDNRIVESLPTIKHLINSGAKVIIVSHLGKPKGEVNSKYSLKPCAKRLSELLNTNVLFSDQIVGENVLQKTNALQAGQVLMLENVRFNAGEEANDEEFAKQLASLANHFVLDAFGTSHRKHASTYGVANFLPSAIGFLIEKELEVISKNLQNPKKPFVAILGGAKVSDKIGVIKNLINKADSILVGGAMAYTLLKAKGFSVGSSLVEGDMLETATEILELAEKNDVNLVLPSDHVVANSFKDYTEIKTVGLDIEEGFMGLDIGPKTVKEFASVINDANLIVWNGPMGVFEDKNFENGTKEIVKAVSSSKAISIIGGGDSAAAVIKFGYKDKVTHISTGGGASLKLIEGTKLPALENIDNA